MVRNRKKEEINDFGWKRDDYEIYLDEFPPTLKKPRTAIIKD